VEEQAGPATNEEHLERLGSAGFILVEGMVLKKVSATAQMIANTGVWQRFATQHGAFSQGQAPHE
jgi:hypothetical protein